MKQKIEHLENCIEMLEKSLETRDIHIDVLETAVRDQKSLIKELRENSPS